MSARLPLEEDNGFRPVTDAAFRDSDTAPGLWALAQLPEVLSSVTQDSTDLDQAVGDWTALDLSPKGLEKDLAVSRTGRSSTLDDYGAEIVAQAGSFDYCFYGILSLSEARHLHTMRLISLAMQVAGITGMRYKLRQMRPRPAQVWPGLLPFLPTPPHSSYPSNHATQAFCTAELLTRAVGAGSAYAGALSQLARRIAVNRERAGVHFSSDSTAGENLGKALARKMATNPVVSDLVDRARVEVAGASAITPPSIDPS